MTTKQKKKQGNDLKSGEITKEEIDLRAEQIAASKALEHPAVVKSVAPESASVINFNIVLLYILSKTNLSDYNLKMRSRCILYFGFSYERKNMYSELKTPQTMPLPLLNAYYLN